MKKSKKLQFSKEWVKTLTNPELNQAIGGGQATFKCDLSADTGCTTGGLSCFVACDPP